MLPISSGKNHMSKANKFLLLFIFILLLVILAVGCEPQIKSGRIVNKIFTPAYSEDIPVHVYDVEVGDISIPVFMNQTVHHPDYYALIIENENKKGKVVTREVPVTKIIHDEYNLKQWIEFKD